MMLEVVGLSDGKRVPAWIDRDARRVVALCGEVAFGVPVYVPRGYLWIEVLESWGYRKVIVDGNMGEPGNQAPGR